MITKPRKTDRLSEAKKYLTVLVLTAVLMSSVVNIINQLLTIVKAKSENLRLENNIKQLSWREKELTEKVKLSTSSGYLQAQTRDMLGLGSKDDYWVILPEVSQVEGVYPRVDEAKSQSNLEKWIEMFTD